MNGSYRQQLARIVTALVIPQGYTLSIAGGFAAAVYHYGFPSFVETWSFVAGAVLGFSLLVLFSGHRAPRVVPQLPIGGLVLFNVVPLGSVPLAAAICAAIPWRLVGFPVAGLLAAAGYGILLAGFCKIAQASVGTSAEVSEEFSMSSSNRPLDG